MNGMDYLRFKASTMRLFVLVFCVSLLFLFGCQPDSNRVSADPNVANAPKLRMLPLATIESGEPNLFQATDGSIYLSWVEYLNDSTDALQFARLEGDAWSTPQTIATGTDWFVNWADFPSLVVSRDDPKVMAAHWLQKRAAGTYDYDVHIVQSLDGGISWGNSFTPHRDSIAAEHGFVSMLPLPDGRTFVTWLDGRKTKAPEGEGGSDDHGHGHHGAMTLRSATFDHTGQLSDEVELDDRICDCCQTSAALTDKGVVVVYRDRSEDEVRDISIVREEDGSWTVPQRIYKDNWQITGCPVNGPAVAADANQVAVVWYTMMGDSGVVKLAFSMDSGASFGTPITLSEQALGRVDVHFLEEGQCLVSWMERYNDQAMLKVAIAHPADGVLSKQDVLVLSSERSAGFPRMEIRNDKVILTWTEVGAKTRVRTGILER